MGPMSVRLSRCAWAEVAGQKDQAGVVECCRKGSYCPPRPDAFPADGQAGPADRAAHS